MKFKVLEGTELFYKLWDIKSQIKKCNNATFDFVQSLGYKTFRIKQGVLAGGISSICDVRMGINEDTDKWKKIRLGEYFPKKNNKSNKELLAKINELPVVEYSVLNDLLNYDFTETNNDRISLTPTICWLNGCITIHISDSYSDSYKPVKGMKEITVAEYNKLKDK